MTVFHLSPLIAGAVSLGSVGVILSCLFSQFQILVDHPLTSEIDLFIELFAY